MTVDDNLDEIPADIMRLVQNVSQAWRRCHRKICKRGRGCSAHGMPCLSERPNPGPPRNPEKAARDNARAMATLQRMLGEGLDEPESDQRPGTRRKLPSKRHPG